MSSDLNESPPEKELNYGRIAGTLLSRWYWIAACLIIAVLAAWLYLSLIHPRYSANTSLMLNEKKSDISQILSSSDDSKSTYESFNLTQSATFIIQSNAFLTRAVSRLNYRYSFYVKDLWSYEELYPESPFHIEIIKQDTAGFYSGLFTIRKEGKGRFKLSYPEPEENSRSYNYGDTIQAQGLLFRILSSYATEDQDYYFRFHTKESLVARTAGALSLDAQNLNILSITHTDVNPYFSADILNSIAKEFVIYESYQRRLSASQRLKFIDDQLDTLSKQVNLSAIDLETFKKQNNLDNLPAKLQADITKLAQQQTQKEQLNIERLAINRLQDQIAANDTKAMLNFNLEGTIGALLSSLVVKLNDQIFDRDDKLTKYTPNSSPVLDIERKIQETKQAIVSNIRQLRERNEDNQRYLDAQINSSKSTLDALPSDAKDFINLQTEYTIKQKIFSSLTEERLKSSIELSAIEPGASIIYAAAPSNQAVWPVSKRIYMIAILAGFAAGICFIFLARYSNRHIRDVGTVGSLTNIPILGLIRKLDKSPSDAVNYHLPLIENPESLFSESVRSLRNNLVHILSKTQGKVICISSELSEEGRSFTAMNLASALSQLEKKVIIVDSDLRKPIAEKLNSEEIGLGAYLANYKSLTAVIKHTGVINLDIIPSGVVPPNPAELLQNVRMEELLSFLKNIYDYVVVDTSPIGVVSDAIPLIEKSDINLFVIKSGKSKLDATSHIEKIAADYNLNNFFIVLNAFKENPLYQPFYSDINTDIYFNKHYSKYLKKHNAEVDDSKWRSFERND
jgi:tyrosine-protein kinase Etk/Wzc